MTQAFWPAGFRATTDDGFPLPGGQLRYYSAGTTTPKVVYSDAALSTSLGSIVSINSAGEAVDGGNVQVMVYPGTGAYRVRLYDADDILIWDQDNIPGAEEEAEESETALPVTPVVHLTSSGTHTTADQGKLFVLDPSGNPFARTLPSAVAAGDGFRLSFHHDGSANAATIIAPGAQNIRGQRVGKSFALVGRGESITLVSNGADWIVESYSPPFRKATDPYFIVLDRISSPPANPDAGARYLLNDTPSGAWSTLGLTENDIAEADGNGSWIRHTPAGGWLAFDDDEKISLVFKDGAWENFQVDPGTSTLKTLIVQHQLSSGTDGGTPTQDAWTTAVLNTSVVNTITDASLASNKITLPSGRYRVKARKVFAVTGESRIRFKTDADSSVVILSESIHSGNIISTNSSNVTAAFTAMLDGEFEISESTDFILQYYVNVNQGSTAAQGLGMPSSISSTAEVYATVVIEDLSAQQGPAGDQGTAGGDGLDAGYRYQWASATSGDPGTGKIRTNHATPASVTEIAVHKTDAVGADLSNSIASWDNSTSDFKARIRWTLENAPQNFMEFLINDDGTDEGDYWTFPVSYVANGGSIANGNDIGVDVSLTGQRGAPGTTVPDPSGLDTLADLDAANDKFLIVDATDGSIKLKAVGTLTSDDIDEGATQLLMTTAERTKLDAVTPIALSPNSRFWSEIAASTTWQAGRSWTSLIVIGEKAGESIADDETDARNSIAIGDGALNAATTIHSGIAIGTGSMSKGQPGDHNIAIGHEALASLNKTGSDADRNIGIGSLSMRFLTTGRFNIMTGRDSGHCLTTGSGNVGYGYRAVASQDNPFGLSGAIELQRATTASNNTGVGHEALARINADRSTAMGYLAGNNLIGGLNAIFGAQAGMMLDYDLSPGGKVMTRPALSGTYSQSGTTITVTATANGAVSGNKVGITFQTGGLSTPTMGEAQWLTVASKPDANTFTITSPVSTTASGNVVIDRVETSTTRATSDTNVIIGEQAVDESYFLQRAVVIGWQAAPGLTGDSRSVLIGRAAGAALGSGLRSTGLGYEVLSGVTTAERTVAIGSGAGANATFVGGATVSNKLIVGTQETGRPLLAGDFANGYFSINGLAADLTTAFNVFERGTGTQLMALSTSGELNVTTNVITNGNVRSSAGGAFYWNGRGQFRSPADGDISIRNAANNAYGRLLANELDITDGITAPSATSGRAKIYVDSADGDLKIKFGDGTTKTIVVDT